MYQVTPACVNQLNTIIAHVLAVLGIRELDVDSAATAAAVAAAVQVVYSQTQR